MPNLAKKQSTKLQKKMSKSSLKQKQSIQDSSQYQQQEQPILVPLLEMADPYYPKSLLAKSLFSGFYFLFFMYSVIFIIAYPILSLFEPTNIFNLSLHTILQTNIIWDSVSVTFFFALSLFLSEISLRFPKIPFAPLYAVIPGIYFCISVYMVHKYEMYFTDRIFIIVLSWGLCFKTISFIKDNCDKNEQQKVTNQKWLKKQKDLRNYYSEHTKFPFLLRLTFFISPIPIYHRFIEQHNPSLKINPKYLVIKTLTSMLCLCVNNILIVKFIQPICSNHQDLSLLALTFKLIPPTFFLNMTLYFLVMDNIMAALLEITRIRDRRLYGDWWNSATIYEFLQKWCFIIDMGSSQFLPKTTRQFKHTINASLLITMTMCIFGRSLKLSWVNMSGLLIILLVTYFLGGKTNIQNNYVVHMLVMGFTPFIVGLHVKYDIFSTI